MNAPRRFYAVLAIITVVGTAVITNSILASAANTPAFSRHWPTTRIPNAHGYSLGNAKAPIQVEEFGDLQCSYCMEFFLFEEKLIREKYIPNGLVRFTFYDFPMSHLRHHEFSEQASMAAACAGDQDKFWDMRDSLLATQRKWRKLPKLPMDQFTGIARSIGIDIDSWNSCFRENKYLPRIRANARLARLQGFDKTPTIIVTTSKESRVIPYRRVKKVLDSLSKAYSLVSNTSSFK
jgi:protein-disulfide isomerase